MAIRPSQNRKFNFNITNLLKSRLFYFSLFSIVFLSSFILLSQDINIEPKILTYQLNIDTK